MKIFWIRRRRRNGSENLNQFFHSGLDSFYIMSRHNALDTKVTYIKTHVYFLTLNFIHQFLLLYMQREIPHVSMLFFCEVILGQETLSPTWSTLHWTWFHFVFCTFSVVPYITNSCKPNNLTFKQCEQSFFYCHNECGATSSLKK